MTLIKFKKDNGVKYTERMPVFSELFNEFFDNMFVPEIRRSTVPAVNIIETNDHFQLEVAAPGLAKEDFKINIEDDVLTVSAEKKNESQENNKQYSRKEFSYVSFRRSFNLPEVIDSEKVQATYENGIMSIVLPKKEEAKPKPAREIKVS